MSIKSTHILFYPFCLSFLTGYLSKIKNDWSGPWEKHNFVCQGRYRIKLIKNPTIKYGKINMLKNEFKENHPCLEFADLNRFL